MLNRCDVIRVGRDAAVRVIDAFVASLDMHELGFGRRRTALTGRPGYDPRALLKLYIYGYLNGLRSSRRLEKACSINLEVIWLLRKLAPDFKTIADFRHDNHCGVTGACKAFVRFCRQAGLFAAAVAVIGDASVRTVLYEAANVILTRPVKGSTLKSCAARLARRAGLPKAKVALARKLAVVMHRMLINETPFDAQRAAARA